MNTHREKSGLEILTDAIVSGKIDDDNESRLHNCVKKVAEALELGEVVLHPTDTIFGLAADATNPKAVSRLREIKRIPANKPLLVLVHDMKKLEQYAQVTTIARALFYNFFNTSFSVILHTMNDALKAVRAEDESMGFRIPTDAFCTELTRVFQKPIVTTSANRHNYPYVGNFQKLRKEFEDEVDLLVSGPDNTHAPSTVVDAREKLVILREGTLSKKELKPFFGI